MIFACIFRKRRRRWRRRAKFSVHRSLFVVRCSLFVVRRSSFVVRRSFDNSIYNYYQSILSSFIDGTTPSTALYPNLQTGFEP